MKRLTCSLIFWIFHTWIFWLDSDIVTFSHKMGSEKEWDGFRSWLHSIAVVTFDLELGQVSKHITLR